MREVKFKFWIPDERIILGPLSLQEIYGQGSADGYNEWDPDIFCKDEETIPLQYTGFKDKNEKEIYDGDILEYCFERTEEKSFSIIHFHKSCLFYIGPYVRDDSLESYFITHNNDLHCRVVLGNIYQNHEMLEKEYGFKISDYYEFLKDEFE